MSVTTVKWVNPHVLRWARERLRMTAEQVEGEARKLRRRLYAPISAQELRDWEIGLGEPALEHLETLAEIYRCPVGYFFLEDIPEEKALPYSLRGLVREESSLSVVSRQSLLRFYELAEWTVHLIAQFELEWQLQIRPRTYPPEMRLLGKIVEEERARLGWSREVREIAGDPFETFTWWRRAIENVGVFCFEMKLDPHEIRGASLWLDSYPFILVNHQDAEAATGRLFTLLHEYGHLLTVHEGVVCDFRGARGENNPEPFANRFAARMLLLPEELRTRLEELECAVYREDWPDALLDKIRRPFAVSRDVIAIMLQELNFAPADFYSRKREQWEKREVWMKGRGGRPTKREQKLREMGYSLSGLLARLREHPALPWLEVSHLLDMRVEKAEEFLRWVSEKG